VFPVYMRSFTLSIGAIESRRQAPGSNR